MAASDLFIGVVTHAASRFPDARGSRGAGARLADAWAELGRTTDVLVEDRDLWSESGLSLDPREGFSYRQELLEEWRWRGFLDTRSRWWMARQGLRILRNRFVASSDEGPGASRRLLNIEFAHRGLWEQGLASGAEVILVLEDDAHLGDAADAAQGIAGLQEATWNFTNLSSSFSADQLGVVSLLQPSGIEWEGSNQRIVLRSEKPVTNTVCALMFRRRFLASLLRYWVDLPLEPLLPIDWKMNRVLRMMVESQSLEASSTLWVEPGPFIQRSLHSAPQP